MACPASIIASNILHSMIQASRWLDEVEQLLQRYRNIATDEDDLLQEILESLLEDIRGLRGDQGADRHLQLHAMGRGILAMCDRPFMNNDVTLGC
jgi:hypothetical protein